MTDTIIDDQDLSAVHYNGTWIRGGSDHEHDQTVASSTRVGDSFTVSFHGNSISVYGTIDSTSGGVLTNYSVDNAPPEQSTSQAGTGDTFNQQFWKSPALDVGEHQLLVTMVKINDDPSQPGEGTIWFDYFLVRDPTIQPPSSKKSRTREIVGGVVGGVLGLLITLAVFLILLKRHRKKKKGIQAQPFLWSKNGGETHSQTNFHVGGIVSDTNVGPISPFPLEQNHENSGTSMPAPAIPNAPSAIANGNLPRKSALINRGRSQVSDRAYASMPPSTTVPPSEPPSEDLAGSSTQDAAAAAPQAPAAQSAVGKHQRTGSRPHVTIPVSMDGDGSGALRSGLSSAQMIVTPTPISESPLQHIDSGMRSINVQTDLPTTRVELPPVYTPV